MRQFITGWALIVVGACGNGTAWANLIVGILGIVSVYLSFDKEDE